MSRSTRILLEEILESSERILNYVSGLSLEEFAQDVEKQDAVFRRFEIIGEAVKGLPDDVRTTYPDIPWRKIAGARDVLIHEYFRVDIGLTWDMVKQDLPVLRSRIQHILDELAD